jgi:hypothetical protein
LNKALAQNVFGTTTEASEVSDNKLSLVLVRDGLNQSGFLIPSTLPKLGQIVSLGRAPPVADPLSSMTPNNVS